MKMYKSETTSNSQTTAQAQKIFHSPMKGIHQCNFQAITKPLQQKYRYASHATSNYLTFSSGISDIFTFPDIGKQGLSAQEFLQNLARGFSQNRFSSGNQGTYTMHCGLRLDDHSFSIFSNKILPHLKAISKLELIFDYAQGITNKGFLIFGKQIRRHLKNLKHLKITLKGNSHISDLCMKLFGFLISKRLVKLEVFSLSLHHFSLISSQCSRPFTLTLEKHLRKLKSSSFQFYVNYNPRMFSDPFPIAPRYRYDKNLTDFQLWTPSFYNEGLVSNLISYLFRNPQVVLRYNACQPDVNGGNVKFVKLFSKDKKKENPLVLDGFGLANQWGPEVFLRALKVHPDYRAMKVQGVSIEKTEENQITINIDYSKRYENRPQPQRLSLHFKGFNSLSKKFFEALNEMMVSVKMKANDLRELKINLKGFREIGGDDFNTFGKSTIPALTNLEKLSLSLEKCGVTGNRFQTLMNSIGGSLKKLNVLDLNFRDLLVLFNDKDLANFMNSLQGIPQLKIFRLNLGNLKITDQGIESLTNNIGQNMAGLNQLCIQCDKCPVTDKSLENFETLIKQLKDLKELNLSFEGCSSLNENSIREFHQRLNKSHQNLTLTGGWFEEENKKMLIEKEEKSLFEIQSGTFTNEQLTKILDNLIKNEIDLNQSEKLPFFCVTTEEVKAHLQQTKELNYEVLLNAKDLAFFAKNVLVNLKDIEKLSLSFSEMNLKENNGESMKEFVKEISNEKSDLKELSLNFKKSQATEELMETLLSEIESHHPKTLENLSLIMTDCEGISQSFRDTWIQRLQAKSISQVNID